MEQHWYFAFYQTLKDSPYKFMLNKAILII